MTPTDHDIARALVKQHHEITDALMNRTVMYRDMIAAADEWLILRTVAFDLERDTDLPMETRTGLLREADLRMAQINGAAVGPQKERWKV